VANVAPTAAIAGDASGVRGQTRNFVLSAGDPSAADAAAGFTFRVNWGDGSPVQAIAQGQSPATGHVYTATGTYTVQVVATDKDGGASLVATKLVTIEVVQLQTDPVDPTKTALVVGARWETTPSASSPTEARDGSRCGSTVPGSVVRPDRPSHRVRPGGRRRHQDRRQHRPPLDPARRRG